MTADNLHKTEQHRDKAVADNNAVLLIKVPSLSWIERHFALGTFATRIY